MDGVANRSISPLCHFALAGCDSGGGALSGVAPEMRRSAVQRLREERAQLARRDGLDRERHDKAADSYPDRKLSQVGSECEIAICHLQNTERLRLLSGAGRK